MFLRNQSPTFADTPHTGHLPDRHGAVSRLMDEYREDLHDSVRDAEYKRSMRRLMIDVSKTLNQDAAGTRSGA